MNKIMKFLLYFIGTIIIVTSIFIYYPRDLEKVLGIDEITVDEISSINLTLVIYEPYVTPYYLMEQTTTDPTFIKEVLDGLSGLSMRRNVFGPKPSSKDVWADSRELLSKQSWDLHLYIEFQDQTSKFIEVNRLHHVYVRDDNRSSKPIVYSLYSDLGTHMMSRSILEQLTLLTPSELTAAEAIESIVDYYSGGDK